MSPLQHLHGSADKVYDAFVVEMKSLLSQITGTTSNSPCFFILTLWDYPQSQSSHAISHQPGATR